MDGKKERAVSQGVDSNHCESNAWPVIGPLTDRIRRINDRFHAHFRSLSIY